MHTSKLSRREALARTGLLVGGGILGGKLELSRASAATPAQDPARPFLFCLNMATIRGQKLGIVKEVDVAAKAGYDGIEPWVETLDAYVKEGGSLPDLKKRI